jgi:hypothetical protein
MVRNGMGWVCGGRVEGGWNDKDVWYMLGRSIVNGVCARATQMMFELLSTERRA